MPARKRNREGKDAWRGARCVCATRRWRGCPGDRLISAATLLAAIGDIARFSDAKHLVGYAGLGARVHDSGRTHHGGRITKAGRKDIRWTMVEAARHAARTHAYWKGQFARLEPRLGKAKAYVAIARRMLVAVWHILSEETADCHADAEQVACALFAHAYRVGVRNLPGGLSALAYTRQQLDRLGLGQDERAGGEYDAAGRLPRGRHPPLDFGGRGRRGFGYVE